MGAKVVPVFILILFSACTRTQETEPSKGLSMLCDRSYAEVVGKKLSTSSDPCDASAKIQAISYECGVPEDSFAFRQKAAEINSKEAEKICEDFCRDLSSKCRGTFTRESQCGFTVPTQRELDVGRKIIQCPSSCKGQAFHYCSIYHGSYFGLEPSLFTGARSNCTCSKKD